jgi:hypothetical protein
MCHIVNPSHSGVLPRFHRDCDCSPSRKLSLMPDKSRPAALRAIALFAATAICAIPLLAQERPWTVSPCELLKKPGMYNETMVSVPGLVLVGPQQFTSHGFDCEDEHGGLRLEFGGKPTDPKDRFRLSRAELEAGVVPLKKDTDYQTMQRLMKSASDSGQTKMIRATLIGRFFPGPAFGAKSGEVTYPSARLVISEVELVSGKLEEPVDFTPASRASFKPAKGCTVTEISVPPREEEDKLQRLSREPSENVEYLSDPKQVAAHAIAEHEKLAPEEVAAKLRPADGGVALKDYVWASPDGLRTFSVTVNRPYWLLPSTYSGDTVIWVPKQIAKIACAKRQ